VIAATTNPSPKDVTSIAAALDRYLVGRLSGVPRVGFPSLRYAVVMAAPGWRPSFGRPFGATLRGRLAAFPTRVFRSRPPARRPEVSVAAAILDFNFKLKLKIAVPYR
jgi:hypothetical protein